MLHRRRTAAQKVADNLYSLERAIDQALAQAAELNKVMPVAWAEAGLSPVVGQDAFDEAAAVFAALAKARRRVVCTHQQLEETKNQIGLRAVNFGGLPKKDDDGKTNGAALSVVTAGSREAA